jgi:hypothetical protein
MSRHGSKPWPSPAGFCVSRVVRDQVRDKLAFSWGFCGRERSAKSYPSFVKLSWPLNLPAFLRED